MAPGGLKLKYFRPWWCSVRGLICKDWCMKQYNITVRRDDLSIAIKAALQKDFEVFFQAKCRALEEAALECNTRMLFTLLRSLKPLSLRSDTRLLMADGVPAGTDTDERSVVRECFKTRLKGEITTIEALVNSERANSLAHAIESDGIVRKLEALPPLSFVITKNEKMRNWGRSHRRRSQQAITENDGHAHASDCVQGGILYQIANPMARRMPRGTI